MALDNSDSAAARAERRQLQASAFDHIGERYDEVFPHKEGQLAAAAWLIDRLKPGARVLDAGCGTGVPTTRQLTDAGAQVTGIDISPVMLELARRSVPEATFAEMDTLDISWELGEFDAVVAFFSLLMLPRAEIPQALTRLRDVLVPGGWLALGMVEADIDDVPIPFLGAQVRVSGYIRDELRDVVTAAGFTVLEEGSLSYAPTSAEVPPETQLTLCCQRAGD
ncbi:MAG TPA: class I SAM-dependent methyltransferase [Streptosporangiaceae bacterium]|jgi:ubiquinone/menaquinone biosynthesis C-methylase UbiE